MLADNLRLAPERRLAGWTGLEPAASGVTGQIPTQNVRKVDGCNGFR